MKQSSKYIMNFINLNSGNLITLIYFWLEFLVEIKDIVWIDNDISGFWPKEYLLAKLDPEHKYLYIKLLKKTPS